MDGHPPRHVIGIASDRNIVPGTQLHQLAPFRETVERLFEPVPVFTRKPQLFDELLVGGPAMRQSAYMIENGGIAAFTGSCAAPGALCPLFRHYRDYASHSLVLAPGEPRHQVRQDFTCDHCRQCAASCPVMLSATGACD